MAFGGLDIGSSGVKCAFFNERGKRLAFARQTVVAQEPTMPRSRTCFTWESSSLRGI